MKPMISRSSVVAAAGENDVVACRLADEVVLLQLHSGAYYSLDAVGLAIWELITVPRPVSEIHQTLLQTYDVEAKQCEDDLLRLLNELATVKLIVVSDESRVNVS